MSLRKFALVNSKFAEKQQPQYCSSPVRDDILVENKIRINKSPVRDVIKFLSVIHSFASEKANNKRNSQASIWFENLSMPDCSCYAGNRLLNDSHTCRKNMARDYSGLAGGSHLPLHSVLSFSFSSGVMFIHFSLHSWLWPWYLW